MVFDFSFEVRGYELDSFGHVNHAVYLNYMEQARWEIIKNTGLYDLFISSGGFLVVIEVKSKYIRELKLFEKATVQTRIFKESFFLTFKHLIRNEKNERVNNSTIRCLFVDKNRNPVDIPDDIKKYLQK